MKLKKIFIAILAICLSFGSIFGATAIYKNATFSTFAYSQNADKSILSDLKKLEDFDEKNYTEEQKVNLIHIKESNQSLYIYAYMNSEKIKYNLSSINISTDSDKLDFNNYKLEVVGKYNNFVKCKVKGLAIKTDTVREYNISSIYTDETSQNGSQITNETAYEVSTRFVFSKNEKNEPILNKFETETITITDKFVGFVRYSGGFEFLGWADACDSHFIAFNTDKDIDKLIEADVYYTSQSYFSYLIMSDVVTDFKTIYGQKIDQKAYLTYTDSTDFKGNGLFAKIYSWNRISTTEEFLQSENKKNIYNLGLFDVSTENGLNEETTNKLSSMKWVLRFAETAYQKDGTTISNADRKTIVGDVSILRLKFEKDGITYNLGAIDNKTTGSETPVNGNLKITVIPNFDWQKIVKIILIVLIVLATIPLVPVILNLLVYLIKALVAIIKFPFRLAKQKK